MAMKAKHAFGSLNDVQNALNSGTIDAYDILFLDGDTEPKVGWIDKSGNFRLVDTEKVVIVEGETLPESGELGKIYIFDNSGYFWNGTEFINLSKPTDVTALEAEIAKKASIEEVNAKIDKVLSDANTYTDEKVKSTLSGYLTKRYEVTHKPEGTLVDYRDKEIRVMCPIGTEWVKQSVGSTGNANMYYMGFKAYAPEDAVSFKEDDKEIIEDQTMYYFENNDFAGIDNLGRKYSIVWLALASYDESSDTWTYFGEKSSVEKYIGWYYSVEWYNANGVVIASDCIRINLTNEGCHYSIEPFYMGGISKEIEEKIEEKITEIKTGYEIVEF